MQNINQHCSLLVASATTAGWSLSGWLSPSAALAVNAWQFLSVFGWSRWLPPLADDAHKRMGRGEEEGEGKRKARGGEERGGDYLLLVGWRFSLEAATWKERCGAARERRGEKEGGLAA
ncbi:hypothetical protein H5410_028403 [Solanum commersonii]|uniref:Uncharacterized protein n=1 Tax=Solanum commersonii TaxID=4109 RepID=A0A9J5Z4U3_SOLCO|nr:hypothetical protein H5410_028403 [Solanum commersonii]